MGLHGGNTGTAAGRPPSICPPGLKLADLLPEPIFTPATKATTGHDENITESETGHLLGDDLYEELRTAIGRHLPQGIGARRRERRHPGRHQVRVRVRR